MRKWWIDEGIAKGKKIGKGNKATRAREKGQILLTKKVRNYQQMKMICKHQTLMAKVSLGWGSKHLEQWICTTQ
jgi:hypothetical protein